MKKILLLFVIAASFYSCKKDASTNDLKNDIIGTWELERNVCGQCSPSVTNYVPGNKNLIILTSDGTYKILRQDTVTFLGSYSIIKSKVCNTEQGDNAIEIKQNASLFFIKLSDNKLELFTPYCFSDATTNTYKRVN